MISSLMPFLRAELYMSANSLGMGLAGVSGDWLAGRFGRRRVLWIGAAVTAIGSLCLAFGQAAWITLAGAFINGYFIAYIIGRFAVSRLVRRALDALFGVMALAGVGILVFWLALAILALAAGAALLSRLALGHTRAAALSSE